MDIRGGVRSHQRADDRRIQTAAEERADGTVGNHLQPDGVAQQHVQLFLELVVAERAVLTWFQRPEPFDVQFAVFESETVTRRKFSDAVKSGEGRNQKACRIGQGVEVRPPFDKGALENGLDL